MKILAVDTALGACSVAVLDGEAILAHLWQPMVRGHAEALAPMVREALEGARIAFSDVDRLAVTTGPGTFTGQRVGLAFMRGLRVALKRPLIGVTTLQAMAAAAAHETNAATIIVVHEAKRGEVYAAAYDGTTTIVPPKLAKARAIIDEIETVLRTNSAAGAALAGTGAVAASDMLRARNHIVPLSKVLQPDALYVAKLAAHGREEGGPAKPLYLRAPDARLSPAAIRLRLASPAESEIFSRLNAANLPEAWDAHFFAHVLESAGGFGFVAEAHGVATGFVLVRVVADDAEILAIAVSAVHRRNGIARRLLRQAARKAAELGAARLFLEVAAGNEAARNLYDTQGFRRAGRRKAYYADGQDALLLQAPLPLEPPGLGKPPDID